jgi:hypothetical protein
MPFIVRECAFTLLAVDFCRYDSLDFFAGWLLSSDETILSSATNKATSCIIRECRILHSLTSYIVLLNFPMRR